MWLHTCLLILYFQHSCRGTPLSGENVRKAEDNDFPFVVSLSRNYRSKIPNPEKLHFCGGALITAKHVLTAAHCLKDETFDGVVVKVNNGDLRTSKSYKVKRWTTFDEWAKINITNKILNDIAILQLSVKVSSNIQPGILTNIPEAELNGKKAVIAGWGLTDNNDLPRYMLTAELDLLTGKNCIRNRQADVKHQINSTIHIFMCSSAEPPVHTNCGDSGSPVFIKPNEIIAVHRGHCVLRNNDRRPLPRENVHMSIAYYRLFITSVTKCKSKGCCIQ